MNFDATDLMFLSMIGVGALLGAIAIVGALANGRRDRQMTHAERMKALEMGREEPEIAAIRAEAGPIVGRTDSGRCFSATGHACFWGFLFAIGAANREGGNSTGVAIAIAASAGAVGVVGLICGTVLAARSPSSSFSSAKGRFDTDGV